MFLCYVLHYITQLCDTTDPRYGEELVLSAKGLCSASIFRLRHIELVKNLKQGRDKIFNNFGHLMFLSIATRFFAKRPHFLKRLVIVLIGWTRKAFLRKQVEIPDFKFMNTNCYSRSAQTKPKRGFYLTSCLRLNKLLSRNCPMIILICILIKTCYLLSSFGNV